MAELALVLFGFVPAPYNLVCMFLNGLPLGMVFGLVLGFLEGRQRTEAMAACLCTSFILADGMTKSVGKALLNAGVEQFRMPAATGALFILPLLGVGLYLPYVATHTTIFERLIAMARDKGNLVFLM